MLGSHPSFELLISEFIRRGNYRDVFVDAGETLYHVQDTWENYFELKEEVDYSYLNWKNNIRKL